MTKSEKIVYLNSLEDMNKTLEKIEKSGKIFIHGLYSKYKKKYGGKFSLNYYAFYYMDGVNFNVTTKLSGENCTYNFRLDGETKGTQISPLTCYRIGQKIYNVPKLDETIYSDIDEKDEAGKYMKSSRQLLWTNPKFDGQEIPHTWIYDLNAAFSSILMTKIPDLNNLKRRDDIVKEDEIGFKGKYLDHFTLARPGEEAELIFDLIESPYKNWCIKLYNEKIKCKAKDDEVGALKAKQTVNFFIGFLQRTNPLMRAYIVESCNDFMRDKIDMETTIFCNTDSIHSTVPRPDLETGSGIGQFKVEGDDVIARYKGANWQIKGEKPKWRGVAEYRLKKENGEWLNILTDQPPIPELMYYFDEESRRIKHGKQ